MAVEVTTVIPTLSEALIFQFWDSITLPATGTVVKYLPLDRTVDWALQLVWGTSSTGSITLAVSASFQPDPKNWDLTGVTAGTSVGTWSDITSKVAPGGAISLANAAASAFVSVPRGQIVSPYLRVLYTAVSGTGPISGYFYKSWA